ncbi:MAG: Calx-beta domain-containing protein [Pirellulales bacterium]
MTPHSIRRTSKKRLNRAHAPQSSRRSQFRRFRQVERLENRLLLASDFGSLPEFRNPVLQFDVNNDGRTTQVDALIIINDLNANGPRQLSGGIIGDDGGSGDDGSGGIIGDDGGGLVAASEERFFIDTNGDGLLTALDVLGVINKLNAQQGEQVRVRLQATDLNGNPVETLSPGQEFQLRGFVKDLREPQNDPTRGVFSAYVDVLFDGALTTVDLDMRSITYGELFPNDRRGTAEPTKVNDIGAFSNTTPYGSQEVLLFTVPMQVAMDASGPVSFIVEDDMSLLFDVTVYGSNQPVPPTEILFVGDQLTVAEQPAASIADLVVPEGNALNNATLTITLTAPALAATTVSFATLAHSGANPATAVEDYTPTNGTVTFAVGESQKTITVPIIGDQVLEPDETFRVVLGDPVGTTIADGEAIVTIQNDDTPPQITVAHTSVVEPVEGTTNAVFIITLSTPVDEPVLVDFATINGTALEPTDYTSTAGTLTFAPGETSRMIVVPVLADAQTEGTEQFSLLLANPRGAQFPGGVPTQMATATITEPSAARVILRLETRNVQGELQSSFEPGDEIRLRAYVTDATAGDPDDQDGVVQMFHDLFYDAGLVTVASTVMFGPSYPDQRTADLGTSGIVNEIGATANLFTPLGGGEFLFWEIAFTADAEGLARFTTDAADVPDNDTLLFGVGVEIDPSEIQFGSIDVLIGEGPALAIGDAQATEGNSGTTAMVFEVTLSSPHLVPVTVSFATSDGTATAPDDYEPATGQITFAPGQTSQNITVNVVGDTVLEPAETLFVTLSNPVNAEITEGRERGTGTILDDEVRTISISDRVIAEGGFGMFTVTLSSPAATPITVNFNTADGTATALADYLPAADMLTFGAGVQTQTIIVQTLPDDIPDDLETFLVQLSGAVGANIEDDTGVGTITEVPLAGLSGFVYVDSNGDGQKGASEVGIAGVTIELFGVAVLPDGGTQQVQFTTQTDASGLYLFENLPSGSYSIHEIQPAVFNDGIDTPGPGGMVTANDWMFINFAEGGSATGFNFGEAGIRLEFVGKRMFLASAILGGGAPAVDLSNGDVFFSFDGGFTSLDVQALSNTAQAATITILDNNLNVLARSTPLQAASLSFAGNLGQPYFVRIGGRSSSVTLNTLVLGGPHASGGANDDIFAAMDDWLN